MSKADTWMPLYIGDYLADTMHLSAEEHGAYLLLIMHYWRNGKIKNDATVIQQIARIKPSRVSRDIVSTVSVFFEVEDGYLIHKRIERELSEATVNKEKKAKQTQAAREAKASKTATVTDSVTETPLPSPSPSQEAKASFEIEGAKGAPPKPEKVNSHGARLLESWELPEDWGEWAEKQGMTRDNILKEEMKFKNYWISLSGAKATKRNWKATWENWIIKHLEEYAK